MKRAIDLSAALTGLILFAPVMALIAIAIWLEDRCSPLYCGHRIARGGAPFRMFKFRTMVVGACGTGVNSTAADDPRITRVGRWLRRAKLDELPQLFNVLRGEMSLVGPRPQVPAEVERYTGVERALTRARPGITDLASIVFADESEILKGSSCTYLLYERMIRPWKSRLALIYVEQARSRAGLDLEILALTVVGLVRRDWSLRGVEAILERLGADPLLRRMAARREPLLEYPPPGAWEAVPGGRARRPNRAASNGSEAACEQLLGRPPLRLDESEIRRWFRGRVALVTGAGGSIGSELCRQIARFAPSALIGLDHAETPLYEIQREFWERFPGVAFYAEIGSVRDRNRLTEIFRAYRPSSVYHAAAYKHVPLMESHVFEAVENNVFGTREVARAAVRFAAEEFILISSDKAVRPSNVMGATKRLAELVCLGSPAAAPLGRTAGRRSRFMAVRFGNVLGSNGSVVPLFQRQISDGGPLTVTHPDMQRFFMTVAEAAQLVLQAAVLGSGGEIFVLDMGKPIRIVDLARNLIAWNGLAPEDIAIRFSGVRPGEKLQEELIGPGESTIRTPHSQIRSCRGQRVEPTLLASVLEKLERRIEARDAMGVVAALQELVPDYTPSARAGCGARSVVA